MEMDEQLLARLTAEKKALSLLGLAEKAGYLGSGEFSTEKAVKEGEAELVIVAADASDNTKKQFRNMCEYYKVPFHCFASKDALGHAIGKEFRASVAVKDAGMAKAIEKHLRVLEM